MANAKWPVFLFLHFALRNFLLHYSCQNTLLLKLYTCWLNLKQIILKKVNKDKIGTYKTPVKMDFTVTVWTVNCVISGYKFTSFSCQKTAYYGSALAVSACSILSHDRLEHLHTLGYLIISMLYRHENKGFRKILSCFCNPSRLAVIQQLRG